MYFLERACSMQVRTRAIASMGQDYPTAPAVIAKNADLMKATNMTEMANRLVWPGLLRKLDRVNPGYRD